MDKFYRTLYAASVRPPLRTHCPDFRWTRIYHFQISNNKHNNKQIKKTYFDSFFFSVLKYIQTFFKIDYFYFFFLLVDDDFVADDFLVLFGVVELFFLFFLSVVGEEGENGDERSIGEVEGKGLLL